MTTATATRTALVPRGAVQEGHRHRRAAQHAVEVDRTRVRLAVGDARVAVDVPPLDRLAFYAGLTAAVGFGLVEWPVAVLTAVGHGLSENRRNRTLRALGEALDAV